jgi:hypothetical protein
MVPKIGRRPTSHGGPRARRRARESVRLDWPSRTIKAAVCAVDADDAHLEFAETGPDFVDWLKQRAAS